MADFCKQCAREIGQPSDFVGMCDDEEIVTVLCEGCGPIDVDCYGVCISDDCLKLGHKRECGWCGPSCTGQHPDDEPMEVPVSPV